MYLIFAAGSEPIKSLHTRRCVLMRLRTKKGEVTIL